MTETVHSSEKSPPIALPAADVEVLRRLGEQVASLAAQPLEEEKQALWYAHNALERPRPVVFCDPENGWNEIIRRDDLQCTHPLARGWEWHLRREIFWGEEMRDDRVITGEITVGYSVSESDWGVRERRIGGENGGAYTWEAPIKDLDDLSMLRYPEIEVDFEATERMLETARSVFEGVLPVRLHHTWVWSVGLTWTLVNLRGLEQIMLDMCLNPEGLHRLMGFLRDGTMSRLNWLEEQGLLHLNNRGQYVGSGGFGWTHELPQPDFDGHVRTLDMWGMAESQETTCVSPAMFAEFVFPYQKPLLERFGLNCYGCCEPVHSRWEVIREAPNLRRISVSPWCDVADIAGKLEDRYILSMKPNPALLATSYFDEDLIRQELREKLAQARGCCVEMIMKDCHTIGGDPRRVVRWVEIAREEADRAERG